MVFRQRTPGRLRLLLLVASVCSIGRSQVRSEKVLFPSDKLQLHGFLWKPAGIGPFPAILWNHGSEKYPGAHPELAKFYTAHSYVFFVPHRREQGRSPRLYIQDLVALEAPWDRWPRMDAEVADVIAALGFLKSQGFVDANRIAISGCSHGGIQTLLAGGCELKVKALVPFAPAPCRGAEIRSWRTG